MWIVRLALRRPYTFVVLAMVILLIGVLTIRQMATDIYPAIDIPVVATIWTYTGLSPQEMEGRITTQFERAVTTTVSGIEHIESQSLAGIAVVKVHLQPGSSVIGGVTEVAAAAQPLLQSLPPGATAPGILQYSASDTAILQLAISSPTLAEQQIYDVATNFLRPRLARRCAAHSCRFLSAVSSARSSSISIPRSSLPGSCRPAMCPPPLPGRTSSRRRVR